MTRAWECFLGTLRASATADRLSQLTAFPLARLLVVLFGFEGLENPLSLKQALEAPQRFLQRFIFSNFYAGHGTRRFCHYRKPYGRCPSESVGTSATTHFKTHVHTTEPQKGHRDTEQAASYRLQAPELVACSVKLVASSSLWNSVSSVVSPEVLKQLLGTEEELQRDHDGLGGGLNGRGKRRKRTGGFDDPQRNLLEHAGGHRAFRQHGR